ncbi:Hypothetical protein EUBREC_3487 [Agathobacter rectalis ATCC 33656]|uniref:Uncharacterized protein n=1 Tax=Agathobacter rectalis (strain ATCC 33656 / DSM 3377 / JCM 17463 / KCTC 5835 / VPI 0990) TaxID=515619 RepID=C4ZFE1_AGARV|nr:Hypothetical protein EUBREC_3487 [Agathobacter rectalis ATCC 33656]
MSILKEPITDRSCFFIVYHLIPFHFILIQYKVNLNLTSTKFIFHKKNMTGFFLKKQSYFYSNI